MKLELHNLYVRVTWQSQRTFPSAVCVSTHNGNSSLPPPAFCADDDSALTAVVALAVAAAAVVGWTVVAGHTGGIPGNGRNGGGTAYNHQSCHAMQPLLLSASSLLTSRQKAVCSTTKPCSNYSQRDLAKNKYRQWKWTTWESGTNQQTDAELSWYSANHTVLFCTQHGPHFTVTFIFHRNPSFLSKSFTNS